MTSSIWRKLCIKVLGRAAMLLAQTPSAEEYDGNQWPPIGEQHMQSIELVVDQLLKSVQDRDTAIRWTVAKSLARIAAKLPRCFVDQVLESLTSMLSTLYEDTAWHG
jgi:hypothetical protein